MTVKAAQTGSVARTPFPQRRPEPFSDAQDAWFWIMAAPADGTARGGALHACSGRASPTTW